MRAGFNLGGFGGDLGGSPSPLSRGPGHTRGNKNPAVTLTPFITQFPAFHHRHKGHSVSPGMGRGLGMVPWGPGASRSGSVTPKHQTHFPSCPKLLLRPLQGFSVVL